MGRKRTIDRDATMAAIEAVVLRDGAGGLSIDAVAREAGISKSSVVYDFRNKAGLLAAFMFNRMNAHLEQIAATRDGIEGPDRWLRAMIQSSDTTPSSEEVAVAMMLAAATHTSEECHCVMSGKIGKFLELAEQDAADLRVTRLAFLALHGLKCLEFFSFQEFDLDTRHQMLNDITRLLDAGLPQTETTAESSTEPQKL